MLESAVIMLAELAAKADNRSDELTAAFNNLADAINKQNLHAPDTSAFEQFAEIATKKAYEMASLSVVDSAKVSTVSTGQAEIVNVYTNELIIESGKTYTRQTHPLLFLVVDYLDKHEGVRGESVRKIAEIVSAQTGQSVGKSWAAVAKNYWQSQANQ
jgi:hypothetical protein